MLTAGSASIVDAWDMRRYSILPDRSERFEVGVGDDQPFRPSSGEVDVGTGVGPVASEAHDNAFVELAATDALLLGRGA